MNQEAYSKAFTAAFLADMARAVPLQKEIAKGNVTPSGLQKIALRDLRREVSHVEGPVLFPNLRALMRTMMNVEGVRREEGLGQWEALSELASSLIKAGSTYISAKQTAETQAKLAEIELQKQQMVLKAAELQAAVARANYATAEGAPGAAATPGIPGAPGVPAEGSGFPSWVPYAAGGLAVLGLGYMIISRMRG